MMRLDVFPDLAFKELDGIALKQIPWAMKKAMNQVGMKARDAVRAGMEQDIHLRRAPFELRQIEISKYADKRDLTLIIQINPKAMNLVRLAMGFDHLPWMPLGGKDYLWLPNTKVFGTRVIANNNPLHPRNLEFGFGGIGPHQAGQGEGSLKGAQRTFALMNTEKGIPVVFQRVASSLAPKSRKRGTVKETKEDRYKNTRLLYHLHDRQHTPVKLRFYEPITKTFADSWQEAVKRWLDEGIRTAK